MEPSPSPPHGFADILAPPTRVVFWDAAREGCFIVAGDFDYELVAILSVRCSIALAGLCAFGCSSALVFRLGVIFAGGVLVPCRCLAEAIFGLVVDGSLGSGSRSDPSTMRMSQRETCGRAACASARHRARSALKLAAWKGLLM